MVDVKAGLVGGNPRVALPWGGLPGFTDTLSHGTSVLGGRCKASAVSPDPVTE